jgi:hypothetical protein
MPIEACNWTNYCMYVLLLLAYTILRRSHQDGNWSDCGWIDWNDHVSVRKGNQSRKPCRRGRCSSRFHLRTHDGGLLHQVALIIDQDFYRFFGNCFKERPLARLYTLDVPHTQTYSQFCLGVFRTLAFNNCRSMDFVQKTSSCHFT